MSSILPKNELENSNFCPSLLGQTFFVRFLGELKTPKSPFEINWPLVGSVPSFWNPSSLVSRIETLHSILSSRPLPIFKWRRNYFLQFLPSLSLWLIILPELSLAWSSDIIFSKWPMWSDSYLVNVPSSHSVLSSVWSRPNPLPIYQWKNNPYYSFWKFIQIIF